MLSNRYVFFPVLAAVAAISGLFFDQRLVLICILIAVLWIGCELHDLGYSVGFNLTVIRRTILSTENDAGPLQMRVAIVPTRAERDNEHEDEDYEPTERGDGFGLG